MPKLIVLHISPSHSTQQSSLLMKKKPEVEKPSVRFSKVIIVNNLKTVYLMKNNQLPGATRNNVNRSFLQQKRSLE